MCVKPCLEIESSVAVPVSVPISVGNQRDADNDSQTSADNEQRELINH